ncbi:dof zinc finger protein DOF2.1 [Daucus carota subsp. sativus]|nr:PREDICTED: dof zinc finger protein DOF2.1 [Daucus carota subsp. sativus]
MDHSSAQHNQEMASHETLESMLVCSNNNKAGEEKKLKPPPEQALKCPRCDSSNTKFCYYNNYSLTQPRYFCKSCRRYWTKGGTLRNVPVGGGCRKNRRSSSSSTSSSSSRIRTSQDHHPSLLQANPLLAAYDSTDLSLAFARLQNGQLGFDHYQNHDHDQFSVMGNNPNAGSTHGFLDAIRNGYLENPFNGFQNASYYGNNAENVGGMNVNVEAQMGNLPYEDLMSSGATTQAVTVTTVKQEGPSVAREAAVAPEAGRVLWGYPWQLNGGGDGGSIMGDVDAAGRQSNWITGINGSTNWHGVFNTPLMQGDVN